MEQSGSGNPSVSETSPRTVALELDLNKTPPPSPPSPREEAVAVGGNGDGSTADHRCDSCGRSDGDMVVCCECVEHFHVDCLGRSEEEREWMCSKCSMECHRRKRMRRTSSAASGGGLGLLDMNASPPREVDADDVEVYVNSELASANGALKYDLSLSLYNLHLDDVYE